jgi:L-asparaginase II
MTTSSYQPIFVLSRGNIPESVHFGALVVVDSRGNLVAHYGDPYAVTYLRSSAKPFQAIPFLENGGQAAFDLTPKEIALICSSHSGTDEHYAAVKTLQAKTGVKETDLLCGTHELSYQPTVEAMRARNEPLTPNRHNCSGKHTGMLAYTLLKKISLEQKPGNPTYINPNHPIQKEILQTFAEMCNLEPRQINVGIDGCSVPTFAVPLFNAAWAYARLCDPSALGQARAEVCRTINASMISNPFMIGGPDSFDTDIMESAPGRILCKGGAEGYQALGIQPGVLGAGSPGMGIIIKISDGDLAPHSRPSGVSQGHARPAVALEVLRQLGALTSAEMEAVADYGPSFPIHNWRNLEVGRGAPVFTLLKD